MEKISPIAASLAIDDHAIPEPIKHTKPLEKQDPPKRVWFKSWPFLLAHLSCCVALSLVLALAVNGYNAIDTSTPHYAHGKLRLRVSDVTTLVSAALVIVKFFVACWSAFAIWRCAYLLTHTTETRITTRQLSFMTRYKLPPWISHPFHRPHGFRSWGVTAILIFILPQSFIAPLLSGAVNWDPSTIPGSTTIKVNSTVPTARLAPDWQQYVLESYLTVRKIIVSQVPGFANLAWSDNTLVSANGTSVTGNGCRHVVSNNGLPVNSTLSNSVIPCIKIQDITWATSASEVPNAIYDGIVEPQSLVKETLQQYLVVGQATLFNPNKPWDASRDSSDLPDATMFSGQLDLGILIAQQYDAPNCTGLHSNSFGHVGKLPYYMFGFGEGTCYLMGKVTLTVGVTTSVVSNYVAPRVVEDQTPINDVKFEPSPWVQDALWLLPDIMTQVSVANSTQLATWDNLDRYAENLIRQSYLAAWDGLHAGFDQSSQISDAAPAESRIKATVSFSRVFSWLGVSLLLTLGGFLLLTLSFRMEELELSEDVVDDQKEEAKAVMDSLQGLISF